MCVSVPIYFWTLLNLLFLYPVRQIIVVRCRDCAELCRLYHSQGHLEAATDLMIEYLEAVLGKGGEYFGIESSLQANSRWEALTFVTSKGPFYPI